MGGSHLSSSSSSLPMSSLLCQESETCFDDYDDELVVGELESVGGVSDDEYVEMLFGRETQMGLGRNEPLVFDDWFKCARLDSIKWVLNKRVIFGFRLETAYLAMTYFDRFISRRSIDVEKLWAIRLLSVACLSLAAKMVELSVPGLLEFQIEEYSFESAVIQRMELMVLSTLEWRMDSITPFAFIPYFIRKLQKEEPPPPSDTVSVSRVVELIVPIMREINLMQYRPSVIALAATLVALDHRLTRSALEFKVNLVSCGFLEMDHVFTCYRLMQAWEAEKDEETRVMHTRDLSQTHLRSHDAVENPSANSSSSKRKRLSFNNCDQNHDMPNEKKIC